MRKKRLRFISEALYQYKCCFFCAQGDETVGKDPEYKRMKDEKQAGFSGWLIELSGMRRNEK